MVTSLWAARIVDDLDRMGSAGGRWDEVLDGILGSVYKVQVRCPWRKPYETCDEAATEYAIYLSVGTSSAAIVGSLSANGMPCTATLQGREPFGRLETDESVPEYVLLKYVRLFDFGS